MPIMKSQLMETYIYETKTNEVNKIMCASDDVSFLLGIPLYY